jgi:hypothetical protein
MVGTAGFEPTTPTPPVWCATWLRYAPTRHQNLMLQQWLGLHHQLRGTGIIPQFIEIATAGDTEIIWPSIHPTIVLTPQSFEKPDE